MELAKDIAFFALMAWVLGAIVRAFVTFNFEEHFNGVQFKGRYLIPTRKYALTEITHTGVRRTMIALKVLTVLSGTVFVIAAIVIQVLKLI